MQNISSNSFNILGSMHFHLWQWSFGIVLFSDNNMCTWPSRIRLSIVSLYLWVLERCPDNSFKDCHRQMPKPVVWIHSLAITLQPKGAIFSHRKRWVVTTGLKTPYNHVKTESSASKSIFHSFHAVLWSMDHTHKNGIPMHLGQILKWQKILVSNMFYHFLFAVSLGNWASKMSKNLG